MKRIKTFIKSVYHSESMEKAINYWLDENPDFEFVDIKFEKHNGDLHAFVIYEIVKVTDKN